jgi:mono/diheme cytochrome c family protein
MQKKEKFLISIIFLTCLIGLMWSFRFFATQKTSLTPLELLPKSQWQDLYNNNQILGIGQFEYKQRCYKCHGVYGQGSYKGANLIDDEWIYGSSENEILNSIYYGVGPMRGYGKKLLPKDLHAITIYVKYLSQAAKENK